MWETSERKLYLHQYLVIECSETKDSFMASWSNQVFFAQDMEYYFNNNIVTFIFKIARLLYIILKFCKYLLNNWHSFADMNTIFILNRKFLAQMYLLITAHLQNYLLRHCPSGRVLNECYLSNMFKLWCFRKWVSGGERGILFFN